MVLISYILIAIVIDRKLPLSVNKQFYTLSPLQALAHHWSLILVS